MKMAMVDEDGNGNSSVKGINVASLRGGSRGLFLFLISDKSRIDNDDKL